MGLDRGMYMAVVITLLSCSYLPFCAAIDTITSDQPIRDSQVISSKAETFSLGFFSPENSTFRYVGIWFNKPVRTVVWVANRDKPLEDSSGIVTVSDAGNLVVFNGLSQILWSSDVSRARPNASAQLLDSGNLILRDNTTGLTIWESFEEPSDSLLPNMKLSIDSTTGEKVMTRSWKSPSDPSIGSFSLGIERPDVPEAFIWNGSRAYWRSGPWNGKTFIGVAYMGNLYLDGFDVVDDKQGTVSVSFTVGNKSQQYSDFLTSQGVLVQMYWEPGMDDWELSWSSLESDCDVYGNCGLFGICNPQKSPICSCLKGFEPNNVAEWNAHNWSGGCVRRTPLQCASGGEEDAFLPLDMVKVPDYAQRSPRFDEVECRTQCLSNCSCVAYAYDSEIGCLSWTGNLIDIQQFSDAGALLYLRVSHSELDEGNGKKVVIIIITVILCTTISISCVYLAWKWMAKRRVMKGRSKEIMVVKRGEQTLEFSDEYMLGSNMGRLNRDLQVVEYDKVEAATNYFGIKLGEGGFGQVYKGMWQDGQEIAVKRLLKSSGQGVEEFMTEVEVISKLQHRNLVRLLGCCIERDDKMLIYEYMENGSLDKILFDPRRRQVLDWRKRFAIIEGIGRGLLYLHRDSRLRIIHRDIKASNILLDEQLNPKISDFGTARICSGNEDKVNTNRVVGTYGYMSPEYAMDGRFSEKSDVFSFGVLLLEIVSGRRNNSFYEEEEHLSLLGFAWKLWNEDNMVAFVDPMIGSQQFVKELLRCLHVGLLCVQEMAKDRPSVSTAVSMLNSEIAHLPSPKQPAFTQQTHQKSDTGRGSSVTFTTVEGR